MGNLCESQLFQVFTDPGEGFFSSFHKGPIHCNESIFQFVDDNVVH